MFKLLTNLIILLQRKDGKTMMAMLWAQQIMMKETVEEAKEMHERVPRLLKEKVKKNLVDSGMQELTV